MFETVTVDEALEKGKRTINYPITAILLIGFGGSILILNTKILPGWYAAIAAIGGFVLGWLYWSFAITKWRLWAFENVRNVHELKRRAIKEKLIWKDDSFWEKTEIRSTADQEKLKMLEVKFNNSDVFTDDYSVPAETVVYYSKNKSLLRILLMVALLIAGLYFIINDHDYILGAIIGVGGVVLGYSGIKHITDKSPQIIINDKGIQTISTPFYTWDEVYDDDVIVERANKSSITYLTYNHPHGSEKLDIGDFEVYKSALEKSLIVYRGRFENARPRVR